MSKTEAKTEAMRYMSNATEILSSKAKKESGYYTDPKYIKMAGDTLWSAVLVALIFKKMVNWLKFFLNLAHNSCELASKDWIFLSSGAAGFRCAQPVDRS